jgi:hypothetical protein
MENLIFSSVIFLTGLYPARRQLFTNALMAASARQVHRAGAGQVQKRLARLGSRFRIISRADNEAAIQNISGLRQGPAGASGAS